MEQERQQALEMKDELVKDFQAMKSNFPANFPDDFPKLRESEPTTSSWITDPQGEEWLQKVDTFLDYLTNDITGPDKTYEEITDEIYIIFNKVTRDRSPASVNIMTCSKEAFVVHMVRECFYFEKLPMACAKNWTKFAKIYTRYVMDLLGN
ncbi:hypothetical protein LCGC14_1120830 [marine sediment metagenome]|uniref:Uncharacterized protein n=1 Tax=marine sediment metagenome TaxID=412755 RepID=A0A0F9M417_9ZZZZ